MQHAHDVLPAGSWDVATAADSICLDADARHRRRLRFCARGGTQFLLDLPQARVLAHGDGLRLADGRIILVEAEPEPLMEVRAAGPLALMRLAWHIGNRHLPAQIEDSFIRLHRDGVIRAMLEGLGARVEEVVAPFTPEGGAYSAREGHHDHAHDHGHDHGHGGGHSHAHAH